MNLTPFHGPPAVPPSVPGFAAHTLLGFGAHGEVWLAEDLSNGAQVALKVGHRAGPEPNAGTGEHAGTGAPPGRVLTPVEVGRFSTGAAEHETALLCRIDHPHIVRLQRVVLLDDNRLAMVLDLAAGGSLASLIAARGRFDPGEVSTLLIPLAGALEHLHRLGVVHGDISPGNVLFTGDGRPQLGDLGVARVLGGRADEVWATPGFADPALTSGGSIDQQAADVWGLAAVGWFALTGGPPAVAGVSQAEVSPSLASDRAGGLAGLLAQCLALDPAGRPGLGELADRAWQAAHPVPVRLVTERDPISSEAGLPPISRQVTRQVAHRLERSAAPVAEPALVVRPALGAGRDQGAGKGGTGNRSLRRPGRARAGAGVAAVVGRLRGTGRLHLAPVVAVTVAVVLAGAVAIGLTSAVGVPGRANRVAAAAGGAEVAAGGAGVKAGGPGGKVSGSSGKVSEPGGKVSGSGDPASLVAELRQALVEIGRSRAGAFATASSAALSNADQKGSPAYLADDALVRRLQARGVHLQGVTYEVRQVQVLRRVGTAVEVGALVTTSGHNQVTTAANVSVAVPPDGPRQMVFTVVPLADGLVGPGRWRVQSVRAGR